MCLADGPGVTGGAAGMTLEFAMAVYDQRGRPVNYGGNTVRAYLLSQCPIVSHVVFFATER